MMTQWETLLDESLPPFPFHPRAETGLVPWNVAEVTGLFVTHLLQRIRLEPASLPHPAPSPISSSNKFSHLVVTVFWLVGTNSKLFRFLNLTGLQLTKAGGGPRWWSPRGFFYLGRVYSFISVIDGLSSDLVY